MDADTRTKIIAAAAREPQELAKLSRFRRFQLMAALLDGVKWDESRFVDADDDEQVRLLVTTLHRYDAGSLETAQHELYLSKPPTFAHSNDGVAGSDAGDGVITPVRPHHEEEVSGAESPDTSVKADSVDADLHWLWVLLDGESYYGDASKLSPELAELVLMRMYLMAKLDHFVDYWTPGKKRDPEFEAVIERTKELIGLCVLRRRLRHNGE